MRRESVCWGKFDNKHEQTEVENREQNKEQGHQGR